MNPVLETGAGAGVAQLVVNMVKLGAPDMPAWALVLISLVAGISTVLLVSLAAGEVLTTAQAAQIVLQGIIAAAGAAGLDRASQAAQAKRDAATAEPGTPEARRP